MVPRSDEKEFLGWARTTWFCISSASALLTGSRCFEENMYLPYSSNKELATLELGEESIYGLMDGLYGRRPVKNTRVARGVRGGIEHAGDALADLGGRAMLS